MNFCFRNKKILSYFLIIPIIVSLTFSGLAIRTVYAVDTVPPVPVSDDALRSKFVGVTVMGYTVPGFSWNGIYILVMKTLLAQITDSIVNWINSGFEGSPSFVTDPKSFLVDVGDEVAGEFINEMTKFGWLCDPYRLNIQIALSLGIGSFKRQRKCTLTGIIKNFDNFVNGTFKEGGWKGWFYLTTNPNANPGTAFLSVQAELQKRIQQRKDLEVKKLDWGKGFLSWRTCEAYSTTASEGSQSSESGGVLGSKSQINDSSGQSHDCVKWSDIKTPGTVIESQLEHTLGTSLRQMELADDIDKIVGALVQQLVKTVLQKGLSSMNSADGWEGTSSDLEERSSDTKITGTCTADTGAALTGETVEWTVYVSGGPSDKTPEYKWNGNEIETNTKTETRRLQIAYNSAGTKKARVTVKKGNKSATIKCSSSVKVAAGDDSDVASGADGYCSANKSAIKTGGSVKWTWKPYSSDSSYDSATYEWKDENGNAIEDAGSAKSFTIYYFESGEKSANVTVTNDGASSGYDCGTVDVSDEGGSSSSSESTTADSCSVDKTSALVNQTVKWSASLADTSENATYNWLSDDTDGPSGDTGSVEVGYTTTGTKSASVEITKGDTTTTTSCSNSVEITNTKLSASCSVDPIAGAVDTGQDDGTEFTWTATASGGVGDYGYNWSGTDGLVGSEETTATTYTEAGNKTAQVTVTSGDESVTVKCGGAARVFSQ